MEAGVADADSLPANTCSCARTWRHVACLLPEPQLSSRSFGGRGTVLGLVAAAGPQLLQQGAARRVYHPGKLRGFRKYDARGEIPGAVARRWHVDHYLST